jgi:cytochrome c peroxidase
MQAGNSTIRTRLMGSGLAAMACMAVGLVVSVPPAMAQGTTNNSGLIPFDQAFFAFEVESPVESLKGVPIWDEIEQMLDNPYAFALEPNVRGNDQGWGSYRLTQLRRRSFIYRNGAGQPCAPGTGGCNQVPLERHIIHPLNYNHSTGEELRLLNGEFEGLRCTLADESDCWMVPEELVLQTDGTYAFEYEPVPVSAGELRVEDDEAAPDFNSPIAPDAEEICITAVDQFFVGPPTSPFYSAGPASGGTPTGEGVQVCGADPGEPGYAGFGVLETPNDDQYSTPAVPGGTRTVAPDGTPTVGSIIGRRLFDPAGCAERNAESPGSCSGEGVINRLRKPTLRPTPGGQPDYLQNSAAALAADPTALTPSNENDYYRGNNREQKLAARLEAAALGKALFWDMQVGSDAVQACASCHFNAGADDRTKNQTNPGVNGGDLTLQLHGGGQSGQNTDLVATDFPFATQQNEIVNDVASSMGVRFRRFKNIPPIGTGDGQSFGPPDAFGVRTLLPDIGDDPVDPVTGEPILDPVTGEPVQSMDPIPLFQGLRRVEPRNTPTLFASAMNFDNFWDGRARHDFNGGSVFGPSDPQAHVFVCSSPNAAATQCTNPSLNFQATRQIIRFVSLASLATGPALSEFEMSFRGRNWAKIGKKLLQGTVVSDRLVGRVTPLANQLVDPTDSVIGRYSNQGGSACAGLPSSDRSPGAPAVGKPGLCISYPGLIRRAFYPQLWVTRNWHLNGCYTDTDPVSRDTLHPTEQCAAAQVDVQVLNRRRTSFIDVFNTSATGTVAIPVFNRDFNEVVDSPADPFDNYVLTIDDGVASATDTNQFTQMEANMPLFFGLAVHAWGTILIPDDSPFDRFMDRNPDSFATFGESGEPALAIDLLRCNQTGGDQPCFTEVGNFKRDPGVIARINCTIEGGADCTLVPSGGSRTGGVDPLMGLDFFLGSNLSLKNPNFRSLRCGECHAGGTLTDHTFEISHQVTFGDRIQEFRTGMPGVELFPEALGRGRVISGFLLEGELQENAQDGIERNVADFCTLEPCVGEAAVAGPAGGHPQGQALFDNGVYNIGVTPIGNDVMRGGNDPFGWPLSLSYLMLKNICGLPYSPGGELPPFAQPGGTGIDCPAFNPATDPTGGGVFEETAQDEEINPGFGEEPADPQLPPYLGPWASNIPVGDESNIDEVFVGVDTVMREPMLEGFVDSFGPFNPAAIIGESFNNARQPEMAMWPNVNRVNAQGSVKAPPLRHVAVTGPYFHNGGKLTLRQVVDFYTRGGDFPRTNSAHRDFLIMNLLIEDEALGGLDPVTGAVEFTETEKEEILVSLVDFLLELTDERVAFQRAPFDQPEIFVPLDGFAPDNGSLAGAVTAGRQGFANNTAGDCAGDSSLGACFRRVPQTGQGGTATPAPNFLGITNGPRLVGTAAGCGAAPTNHYCH